MLIEIPLVKILLVLRKRQVGSISMARSFSDRLPRCFSEAKWTNRRMGFVMPSIIVLNCTDDLHLFSHWKIPSVPQISTFPIFRIQRSPNKIHTIKSQQLELGTTNIFQRQVTSDLIRPLDIVTLECLVFELRGLFQRLPCTW